MPDGWICPTCGAVVPDRMLTCPFCGTTATGEMPPSVVAIAAGYIGHALVVCVGWTILFALWGLVAALATGDWDFMTVIVVLGLIAGVLFGIGDIVIQMVQSRQESVEEESNGMARAASFAGHVLAIFDPILKPFVLLGMALSWLVTKDYRHQAPGRGRRALVGAIVLGLLGIGILTFAYVVVGPPPPGGMTLWEGLLLVLVLSGIGALLGLLSDSW